MIPNIEIFLCKNLLSVDIVANRRCIGGIDEDNVQKEALS